MKGEKKIEKASGWIANCKCDILECRPTNRLL